MQPTAVPHTVVQMEQLAPIQHVELVANINPALAAAGVQTNFRDYFLRNIYFIHLLYIFRKNFSSLFIIFRFIFV